MVVMGAGTGGTITGVARKIKEKLPDCKIIGVDPQGSILAVGADEPDDPRVTMYDVEGIGYDFIPTVLERELVDKWYKSNDSSSFLMARKLISAEGLLCGGSSGAAMSVAVHAAKSLKPGQKCVVVLPDGVRNYMTKFLSDTWMVERGFMDLSSEMSSKHCMVLGMVSLGNLMSKILARLIDTGTPVSKAAYDQFKKVTLDTTLGKLSTILEHGHFALVVAEQMQVAGTASMRKEVVIGIVTNIDLLRYITKREKRGDLHSLKEKEPID
ncbi:cysteine synthase, putative [Ixodes scapularis]|uniref:Cysteine synthase, putative n=1 Tax=Ixodes scapularis TaxID=6945 RepID=B7QJ62_IXOSC|nr:cysteine synthase, putative [Ixodes scapularis]|eukprot:XP_002415219.1 cysteine synthase, putative [Ixodes scapularis]